MSDDKNFRACMAELKAINANLERVGGLNVPLVPFIVFWMGFVPLAGFLLALLFVGMR